MTTGHELPTTARENRIAFHEKPTRPTVRSPPFNVYDRAKEFEFYSLIAADLSSILNMSEVATVVNYGCGNGKESKASAEMFPNAHVYAVHGGVDDFGVSHELLVPPERVHDCHTTMDRSTFERVEATGMKFDVLWTFGGGVVYETDYGTARVTDIIREICMLTRVMVIEVVGVPQDHNAVPNPPKEFLSLMGDLPEGTRAAVLGWTVHTDGEAIKYLVRLQCGGPEDRQGAPWEESTFRAIHRCPEEAPTRSTNTSPARDDAVEPPAVVGMSRPPFYHRKKRPEFYSLIAADLSSILNMSEVATVVNYGCGDGMESKASAEMFPNAHVFAVHGGAGDTGVKGELLVPPERVHDCHTTMDRSTFERVEATGMKFDVLWTFGGGVVYETDYGTARVTDIIREICMLTRVMVIEVLSNDLDPNSNSPPRYRHQEFLSLLKKMPEGTRAAVLGWNVHYNGMHSNYLVRLQCGGPEDRQGAPWEESTFRAIHRCPPLL